MKKRLLLVTIALILLMACSSKTNQNESEKITNKLGQKIYQDKPFIQDYSIKYYFPKDKKGKTELFKVASDRNENIQIASSDGLLFPYNGHFLAPGELLPERTYRYMIKKKISGIISYQNQFVYSDANAIFSNAWAGNIYNQHGMKKLKAFAGGSNFDFLISDGNKLR